MIFLLRALLSSHAIAPRLNVTAFQSLFEAIAQPQAQDDEANILQTPPLNSAGPSRLVSASAIETSARLPLPLQAALLDIIWAVDVEIELRRELAETLGLGDLATLGATEGAKGKAKGPQSPAEAAQAAKGRISDLVRVLLVSLPNCS